MRTLFTLLVCGLLSGCGLFTDCAVKEATGSLQPLDTASCQALFMWSTGDLDLHPRDFGAWEAQQLMVHLGTHVYLGQKTSAPITFTGDVYDPRLDLNVPKTLGVGYADLEVLEASSSTLKLKVLAAQVRMPVVMAGGVQRGTDGPGTFVGEVTAMAW